MEWTYHNNIYQNSAHGILQNKMVVNYNFWVQSHHNLVNDQQD